MFPIGNFIVVFRFTTPYIPVREFQQTRNEVFTGGHRTDDTEHAQSINAVGFACRHRNSGQLRRAARRL